MKTKDELVRSLQGQIEDLADEMTREEFEAFYVMMLGLLHANLDNAASDEYTEACDTLWRIGEGVSNGQGVTFIQEEDDED